jgi:hypothetical protein
MTRADSVHSTPLINTSVPDQPLPTLGGLYLPTDVIPEQLFRAIGWLRKEARDEIYRLVRFLDETDDYVSRELEDDDSCLHEDGGDPEPSLGSFDRLADQSKAWLSTQGEFCVGTDAEVDDCDKEDDDPAEESEPSGIGDYDGLQEQHSGRVFPSGLKIEGVA